MLKRRTYSKRTSQEDTKKIIKARIKLNHLFLWKSYNKNECWRAVAKDAGLDVDVSFLKKKWGNLEHVYKKLAANPTGKGRTVGNSTAANWPYFKEMHKWALDNEKLQSSYYSSEPRPCASMSESEQEQEDLEEEETYKSEETTYFLSPTSPDTQSLSSTVSDSHELPIKQREKTTLEEMEEISKRIEKKVNAIYRGIYAIFKNEYDFNIEDIESD